MKKIILNTIEVLNPKERRRLGRLTLAHALVSLADIASLVLLLALIHQYTQAIPQAGGGFSAAIGRLQQIHFLLPLLLFLLLFLLKNIAAYLAFRSQYLFVYGVALRLSRANLLRYLNGNYKDYAEIDSSVQINQVSYQPMEFCSYVLSGIQQLFTESILTLIAITAILIFNAKLFLLLLLVLLPPVILTAYVSKRKLRTVRSYVKESSEKATQYLQEALSGYVESNIYHKKAFFTNRYTASQGRLNDALARLQITQAIPARFIEVFAVLGLLVMIMINKYSGNSAIALINIGAFMAAAYKIIPGITRMANISAQMRMFAYTIKHVGRETEEPAGTYNRVIEKIQTVSFSGVSFTYGQDSNTVRIDLKLAQGDLAGISSPSGKGKTTMLNLLLGFLEPQTGSIRINDRTMTATERRHLWPGVAYVKQQTFLLFDTLRRNITLEEEGYDERRLQQTIRMAGLQPFIDSFPEGLDKVISDSGKNISGGQRQRIALARAFYKDAGLILLDEPFNELDDASETAIMQHLRALSLTGKIIVLITHNKDHLDTCTQTISLHEA